MKFFRIFTMIIILCFIAGCSATRLPDYSPLSAHQYTHRNTQNGLIVAIHPMTETSEIEHYFGTNLLANDILPVLVVVENRNADVSFILRKQEIQLLNEGSESHDASKRSEAVGNDDAAMVVGVAAAALISIPLILVSVGMESHNAEVRRNFAMKELQQTVVSPGDTKSGFVYFKLPKPTNSPDRWRFQIKAVDLKSKMPLTFVYVFTWQRS